MGVFSRNSDGFSDSGDDGCYAENHFKVRPVADLCRFTHGLYDSIYDPVFYRLYKSADDCYFFLPLYRDDRSSEYCPFHPDCGQCGCHGAENRSACGRDVFCCTDFYGEGNCGLSVAGCRTYAGLVRLREAEKCRRDAGGTDAERSSKAGNLGDVHDHSLAWLYLLHYSPSFLSSPWR